MRKEQEPETFWVDMARAGKRFNIIMTFFGVTGVALFGFIFNLGRNVERVNSSIASLQESLKEEKAARQKEDEAICKRVERLEDNAIKMGRVVSSANDLTKAVNGALTMFGKGKKAIFEPTEPVIVNRSKPDVKSGTTYPYSLVINKTNPFLSFNPQPRK